MLSDLLNFNFDIETPRSVGYNQLFRQFNLNVANRFALVNPAASVKLIAYYSDYTTAINAAQTYYEVNNIYPSLICNYDHSDFAPQKNNQTFTSERYNTSLSAWLRKA